MHFCILKLQINHFIKYMFFIHVVANERHQFYKTKGVTRSQETILRAMSLYTIPISNIITSMPTNNYVIY